MLHFVLPFPVLVSIVSMVVVPVFGLLIVAFATHVLVVVFPPAISGIYLDKMNRMTTGVVTTTVATPVPIFLGWHMQVHHRRTIHRSTDNDRLHIDDWRRCIVTDGDLTVDARREGAANGHIGIGLCAGVASYEERYW